MTAIAENRIIKALGGDLRPWAKRCHEASLQIIRSGCLPKVARVARGMHKAVQGQHSWIALGDPYSPRTKIVDATIWAYTAPSTPRVVIAPAYDLADDYQPKGAGSIWDYGRPADRTGVEIKLKCRLSESAKKFLKLAAPNGLDYLGWSTLANSPVGGWPSKEIITAMAKDKRLRAFVPIDVIGMLTDLNPGKLYW